MDTDATVLEQALGILRTQFNGRVAGSLRDGQVTMRKAVEAQLGIDELAADRIVKKLSETGRVQYVGGETDTDPTAGGGTGPILTMPGTTSSGMGPMTLPTTAALSLGAINNPAGVVGGPVTGVAAAAAPPANAEEGGLGGSNVGNAQAAEDRSGATMGQLGDTNVEGPRPEDMSGGYWRIG
ncbi:MAG: hypothetical protein M3Z04_08320 [Chloroflexota bacterium]|nr:hypothetical protein [Chloroflexota bacterium]